MYACCGRMVTPKTAPLEKKNVLLIWLFDGMKKKTQMSFGGKNTEKWKTRKRRHLFDIFRAALKSPQVLCQKWQQIKIIMTYLNAIVPSCHDHVTVCINHPLRAHGDGSRVGFSAKCIVALIINKCEGQRWEFLLRLLAHSDVYKSGLSSCWIWVGPKNNVEVYCVVVCLHSETY